MSKDLHIRIDQDLYQELKNQKPKTYNWNFYINMILKSYLHPLPTMTPDQNFSRELQEITQQMDDLQKKQQELLDRSNYYSHEGGNLYQDLHNKIKDRILKLLTVSSIGLTELQIASELEEDADIVYIVLAKLKQEQKIKEKEWKWYKI